MSGYVTRGWYDPDDGRVYRIIDDVPHTRKLYVEQMVAASDLTTERTSREAAEAAVARMREQCEALAARYDLIAAEHQHNADLVGEASSVYRIHLNLAGGYRERAADVRALLEGRRYSEDEHG